MAEKEASQSEAAEAIDYLALEMEIDREIDSLLVPAAKRAQGTMEEPKAAVKTRDFPESRPGPGVKESAGSPGDGVNFDALQVEIDKEIDSLFVPEGMPAKDEGSVQIGRHEQPKRAQRTAEEPKAAGKTSDFPESRPGHGVKESAGSPGDGVNFDALQVEIDKEIDSLFVPEGMPAKDEGPVQIDRHEQPKRTQRTAEEPKAAGENRNFAESRPGHGVKESAGSPGDGFNLDALQVEIDKEIDSLFVPEGMPAKDEGPVQIDRHEQPKRTQRTAEEPKTAGKNPQFSRIQARPRRQGIGRKPGRRLQSRRPPGRDR